MEIIASFKESFEFLGFLMKIKSNINIQKKNNKDHPVTKA